TMGWQDREYAKWTVEERRRFFGHDSRPNNPRPSPFGPFGPPQSTGQNGVLRRGVGPAILVSGVLIALGHFPASHPILPMLQFRLPGLSSAAPNEIRPTGTINTPGTATVGSTLTLNGAAPQGNGPVTVEGSHDGGQTWQTLTSVTSANGSYS